MASNKKRWKIQALATFMSNPHFFNFFNGRLFKGNLKAVCVPGLNCYSCPGATASCPIGSLQAVIGSAKYKFSYYIVGFIILIGVLLGRLVCGFLCPFGWFQDLLHKIPSKKFSTKKFSFFKYLKYIILLLLVFILPAVVINEIGMGDPYFCKYACPVGILQGGIPLSIANTSIRASLGSLFTWKLLILISVIVFSVFFYRPFCKYICPLGAFYALFNKISVFGYIIDNKCTSCKACSKACKMDVDVYKTPNHTECIRCGDCIATCPHNAIKVKKVI